MKKLVDFLEEEMKAAFEKAGYDPNFAKVTVSNRPDLCEYQCNGAMAAAKTYHKAPMIIAGDVAVHLEGSEALEDVQAVNPGFINMKVKKEFLGSYTQEMREANQLGVEHDSQKRCIILDYGGANVAKPLHVGHLRSAIIGECLKRILRFKGHEVIGDVHLGDWGYQMGLVITELRKRNPELVYFDEQYEGEYPEEAPFTIMIWRRSIHMRAHMQRSMRIIRKKRLRRLLNYKMAEKAIVPFGSILCVYLSPI